MPSVGFWRSLVGLLVVAWVAHAGAQAPAPAGQGARKPPARPAQTVAAKPAPPPAVPVRGGKGWQVGSLPAWVVAPPAVAPGQAPAPASGARREQLVDIQHNHALPRAATFVRLRSVALDAKVLGQVSQPQVSFNPAFQTVLIHHVTVQRDGQLSDRLAEARIEPMRREQRLEQQMIDGLDTLLIVLPDVRVGDAVEVAYTVVGENPIFEGRVSGGLQLAWDTPVDLLHHRVTAPAARPLNTRRLATDVEPERWTDGAHQVLRVVRHQVAGITQEQGTPPWFKVYPAIDYSEYASWAEVSAWAERLFALPSPTPAAVAAQADELKARRGGLTGAALVAETLRFVQEEVRYFSVSLGESSHRPKPPQQTLAERLGDCKDKVVLFNTLLRELGFEPQAALVSMRRNRGIEQYLPSHDVFDHVITRLELDGRAWFLDPTLSGQGLNLATMGQFPFGRALVVGAGAGLSVVPEPEAAQMRLEYEQLWDLTRPGEPARLESVMRVTGLAAERWRGALAAGGLEPVTQALAGGYARLLPGIALQGKAESTDDREANRFELRHRFEVPEIGTYERGSLSVELMALELLDVLSGPSELQRRTPYLVDQPKLVEHRTVVRLPQPLRANPPPPVEVVDRQFRFSLRMEVQGTTVTFLRRYERRTDEVPAADMVSWRDKIMQARQATSGRVRMALLDGATLNPAIDSLTRRLRSTRGWRDDQLQGLITRNEVQRLIDTRTLEHVKPGSSLAARVLVSRAVSNNLIGDPTAGKTDAEAALTIRPDDADALDALGVAQVGLGELDAALATFGRINPQARPASAASWMGSLHLLQGRPAEAEPLLREAVATGSGEGREFALIWLFLAAEAAGGRGRAAVADEIDGIDPARLTGAILRHLTGRIDRDALLKAAREKADMERLNLAEAYFFIGQLLAVQGRPDEAHSWFRRTVDLRAFPYREHAFAEALLKRERR